MMKTKASLSVLVVFGALLCFAPSAFSQSTIKAGAISAGNRVLSNAPAALLTFAFGPGGDPFGNPNGGNGGNGNGCKQSDSNFFGSNRGGNCQAVPEGGTSFVYLAFAGLCCLGAMVYRLRRQRSAGETI
ncbi:MAG: hypothetical protein WB919_19695 [Candidatus Sulfotelmatobacter sp.]